MEKATFQLRFRKVSLLCYVLGYITVRFSDTRLTRGFLGNVHPLKWVVGFSYLQICDTGLVSTAGKCGHFQRLVSEIWVLDVSFKVRG